jgi:hypothetical protein
METLNLYQTPSIALKRRHCEELCDSEVEDRVGGCYINNDGEKDITSSPAVLSINFRGILPNVQKV